MTMRRFFESRRALRVAAAALVLLALIGCENPGGSGPGTPVLLDIEAQAARTDYILGESLKPDTITVIGAYSDGTTEVFPISAGDIAGYNKNTSGEQVLTVTARGKSAAVTVRVTDDPAAAKEILTTTVDKALDAVGEIALSEDGGDVPEGIAWVTPEQKAALDGAVAAAQTLAASGGADIEAIVAALEAVEKAAEELAALAETQTGAAANWSYTVTFDLNGAGGGTESRTVASPATRVGGLPAAPVRSGYTFAGWNTQADGLGSAFVRTTPVTADITVYARWTAVVNAAAPVISVQPQDTAAYGLNTDAAALTVTAASPDGGTLSYQWRGRVFVEGAWGAWADIEGAAGASYTPPTAAIGVFAYYARVTNVNSAAGGTATVNSNTAVITINAVDAKAPVISIQPREAAAYLAGEAADALTVTAESPDGGTLDYQWRGRVFAEGAWGAWTDMEGAAGASYTPPTAAAGVFAYYVRITNTNNAAAGSAAVNSNTAVITVTAVDAAAPVVSVQPREAAAYLVGDAASALTVTAESPDGGTLGYQWRGRTFAEGAWGAWTNIEGATGASYTPPTAAAGISAYYARVTNTNNGASGAKTAAVNSNTAVVTVGPVDAQPPVISVQPREAAAYLVGDAAGALTVTAESPDGGTLGYQWRGRVFAEGAWGAWTDMEGATGASYTPPTAAAGISAYYARVTNTNNGARGAKTAAVNSNTAVITVTAVDAAAPVISVQPREAAAYFVGEAAGALTVTAESPDGGTLGYQWRGRVFAEGAWGAWTNIEGATGAAYTPPTAAAGISAYYARVTNTNNGASGAKTAAVNSDTAVITVNLVNAKPPLISVQPQSAEYDLNAAAAALTVTAESPDGGTLGYQWRGRAFTGGAWGAWTDINGATEASYTPPTAAAGTVAYYARVTNTNDAVEGVKTAAANSDVAVVAVKFGDIGYVVWANEDNNLISNMPGDIAVSRSLGETLVVTAADDLTVLFWSVNGQPRGSEQSFIIAAANYAVGSYTLGLAAEKNGVPYSISISFMVDN